MDEQIKEMLSCIESLEERVSALEGYTKAHSTPGEASEKGGIENLPLTIANKVGDCEESDKIQDKVLDATSLDAKVLLCFYISHKYFNNAWLKSGDVQKITSHLGIKVDIANASRKMKALHMYLESGKVRKNGTPTPYRLNRKGLKLFEEILNG